MDKMLDHKNTNGYWKEWCRHYEEAAIKVAQVAKDKRKEFIGHGSLNLKTSTVKGAPAISTTRDAMIPGTLPMATRRVQKMATRCRQWSDRLMVEARGQMHYTDSIGFAELNCYTEAALIKDLERDNPIDIALMEHLQSGRPKNLGFAYKLRYFANKFSADFEKQLIFGQEQFR